MVLARGSPQQGDLCPYQDRRRDLQQVRMGQKWNLGHYPISRGVDACISEASDIHASLRPLFSCAQGRLLPAIRRHGSGVLKSGPATPRNGEEEVVPAVDQIETLRSISRSRRRSFCRRTACRSRDRRQRSRSVRKTLVKIRKVERCACGKIHDAFPHVEVLPSL